MLKLISLYIPIVILDRLKTISGAKGISYSELIRRILDEWLEGR